jgi:hypothetical protein
MKVKMFDKDWEVKDLKYKEKRQLWKLSIMAFDDKGQANQSKYYDLLNEVELVSGLSEKDYFKDDKSPLSMAEIDLLLQEVFSHYMGLNPKG